MKFLRYFDQSGTTQYACELPDGMRLRVAGDIYSSYRITAERADVVRLLAPVEPTQILGIGLNYRQHAVEVNAMMPERPILFAKGLNTLQHPDGAIILPQRLPSTEVDYEGELAVVIGRACKNVTRERALDYVLGYTCANDVSARDHQIKLGGGQWCRGKFFDSFSPLGPFLIPAEDIPDPNNLRIRTMLNERVVQDSNTADMIFDVRAIIEYLSGSTTLLPGTVILTGTPQGVGMAEKPQPRWLRQGDIVKVEIEAIGCLSNPVELETQ